MGRRWASVARMGAEVSVVVKRLFDLLPRVLQRFLLAAVIVVLTQLLAQAGTRLVASMWPGAVGSAPGTGAWQFAAAAICVLVVFGLGHLFPRPTNVVTRLKAMVAVAGVVATNMLLNTVQEWTAEAVGDASVAWALLFGVWFVLWTWVALHLLPRVQQWFQLPVDRQPVSEVIHRPGRVVLVMMVSRIDAELFRIDEGGGGATVTTRDLKTCETRASRLCFRSLREDVEALDKSQWSWQQILRGVAPAVCREGGGDSTTIILVGSSGPGGSFGQLELCRGFLRRYPEMLDEGRVRIVTSPEFLADAKNIRAGGGLGHHCAWLRRSAAAVTVPMRAIGTGLRCIIARIRPEFAGVHPPLEDAGTSGSDADFAAGIDFEDFNAVRKHVFDIVLEACRQVGDDRVFVDVTGGQKTTSIAAAVATTGETGRCQYVQTNAPNHVLAYDLHPPEQPTF